MRGPKHVWSFQHFVGRTICSLAGIILLVPKKLMLYHKQTCFDPHYLNENNLVKFWTIFFATLISDHNHILDWDMMIAYANRILTKMALYIWLCVIYLYECVKNAANATQNRQKNPWENAKQLHFFCMCVCVFVRSVSKYLYLPHKYIQTCIQLHAIL